MVGDFLVLSPSMVLLPSRHQKVIDCKPGFYAFLCYVLSFLKPVLLLELLM